MRFSLWKIIVLVMLAYVIYLQLGINSSISFNGAKIDATYSIVYQIANYLNTRPNNIGNSCFFNQQYIRDPGSIPFSFNGYGAFGKSDLNWSNWKNVSELCMAYDKQGSNYLLISGVAFHEEIAFGYSMFPTIIPQNVLLMNEYKPNYVLRVGDIVKANITGLNYSVFHRVIAINDTEGFVITKGDNNILPDRPIKKMNISAIVVGVVYRNLTDEYRS